MYARIDDYMYVCLIASTYVRRASAGESRAVPITKVFGTAHVKRLFRKHALSLVGTHTSSINQI